MSFPTGDERLTQILVRNSLTKYSSFNFWCFTCLELKLFTPLLIGDRKISFSLGSIFILLISLCKEIKILLKPFSALIWKDTKKQWQYFSHSFTDSFHQNIIPLFLYIYPCPSLHGSLHLFSCSMGSLTGEHPFWLTACQYTPSVLGDSKILYIDVIKPKLYWLQPLLPNILMLLFHCLTFHHFPCSLHALTI